mmetsp:Transcript_52781/g.112979  ORF Transcript_52781/g.112979 Transcript_52781/m.112979 type:complete len:277 (+) Transcript_52781:915-1745(+)
MTPAAFSMTVGCSEAKRRMRRLIAPACAMAKRFSWVSASDSSVPKQFSIAGTKFENSKTLSKKGMPPAFRMVAFTASTAERFQRALAAFSCKTSSVGFPMHWINACTPPASAIKVTLASSAPKLVTVMAATARRVNGKPVFNKGTSFLMPSSSRTAFLQSSSTTRLSSAPVAAKRASSGMFASSSATSSFTPSNSRILSRWTSSRAKLPRHSADFPTMTISFCWSIPTRAFTPSALAISSLLSSSTLRFFRAPAAARIQASLSEVSSSTREPMPPD